MAGWRRRTLGGRVAPTRMDVEVAGGKVCLVIARSVE